MTLIDNAVDSAEEARKLIAWKKAVLARDANSCVNCLRKTNIAVSYVIPPEAGGELRVSNGVSICRQCRVAAESVKTPASKIDNKTPLNFLISRKLYNQVKDYCDDKSISISALIRQMISLFIKYPEQFEDLELFQDPGSEIKVNAWCDGDEFSTMKKMCQDKNVTLTNTLKSLLLMAISNPHIFNKIELD